MGRWRLLLLGLLGVLVAAFFLFDLGHYLSLETLKARQAGLDAAVAARPWLAAGLYLLLYVAVTALSLPGATLLTLIGGALFGLLGGTLLVSLAATLGATLAMLISRYLLRDWVRGRFAARLAAIDRGVAREGAFYLFALRLVPLFPFFLINLAMGLTSLPARTFWWVSQLGMLPGTLVYVNAGRELGRLESLAGILSPGLLGAFVLLGIFPLLARRLLAGFEARRVYAGWPRPRRFERNLVVIGAGAGGLVSAYIAAALQARVTLIEQRRMGGDCLNTGCVPSKALIRSARLASELRCAEALGFVQAHGEVDFAAVMERVQRVIRQIAPHVTALEADSRSLRLEGGERLQGRWLSLDTGAPPRAPAHEDAGMELLAVKPFPAFLARWQDWQRAPERLAILGGGAAGVELALAMAGQVPGLALFSAAELLAGHPPALRLRALQHLQAAGVQVRERCPIERIRGAALLSRGQPVWHGPRLLLASGASPLPWLRSSGLASDLHGFVAVAPTLQSLSHPQVFASGDCASLAGTPHNGVHAVRQGPLLAGNLAHALSGQPLQDYRPQRHSLVLLADGRGGALLSWAGFTTEGRWCGLWKDWLDRRFMRRHQGR